MMTLYRITEESNDWIKKHRAQSLYTVSQILGLYCWSLGIRPGGLVYEVRKRLIQNIRIDWFGKMSIHAGL